MQLNSLKVVSDHLVERLRLDGRDNSKDLGTLPGSIVPKEEPVDSEGPQDSLLPSLQSKLDLNMNSNNFMYRTMFLLSDSLQPNTPQHNRPLVSSGKKAPTAYSNVCDKGCQCEGPNSLFCGSGSALMFPHPDGSKANSLNPKHLMSSYGPIQLSSANDENDFSLKKNAATMITPPTLPAHPPANSSEMHNPSNPASSDKVVKERPHTCEDCGKTFLLKHHLVTHARVHSGERPHACPHCGKSFAHKHCLSTHLLLHTSDRPYTCQECNKSFTLKHHLVTHARVHSRDRPFVCQECGRTFPQKRHLVTHGKFHSGERPFVCPECGESFSQEEHLIMHSRFHGGQRPYSCQDCGVSFARKFELVNHGRIHGRVPHSCAVCGKEFLQKRTLLAHSRLHTASDETEHPYSCIHCGEAFTAKSALTAHTCGDKEKNFVCRECGNGFSSREGLSLHLRLHAGDRSFVTDLCSLAAAFQHQQPGLNQLFSSGQGASGANQGPAGHSQGQSSQSQTPSQPQTPQPPGAQSVSSQSQPHPSHVHGHTVHGHGNGHGSHHMKGARQNHLHGHPAVVPKPKPHVCQDCGRAFTQKHGLLQHNKRYTNGGCEIRRFACDKCGKAFLQKNHLVLHERQHLEPHQRSAGGQAQAQAQAQAAQVQVQQNPAHGSLSQPTQPQQPPQQAQPQSHPQSHPQSAGGEQHYMDHSQASVIELVEHKSFVHPLQQQ
ncbi:hypothetical protein FOCC_FOCC000332 [Frankliniella occidentalis]|uniref:Zinc finger protein 286B isoform X1 n=1 Tax=Frankliniella occidentalis TaxID=133901 RepID=A0A6J1S2D1_FRAOC|nr:putative zinc finger protein 286B isoform X1 [Frankliniella occidentalis]KAE8752986.1 hypothetical protein FOCC_FOCC000332 [Frankliniella occidentalis]